MGLDICINNVVITNGNFMSTYTAFRCPNELLKRAKYFATAERRSLSNYIVLLMQDDATRRAARQLNEQEKTNQHLHRFANSI